ncbi:hypothetical protein ACOI1C_12930 [Bacillus sp. DJP31]
MMWVRFIIMGMFSLTAITLFSYQGIEIFHAFVDLFTSNQSK